MKQSTTSNNSHKSLLIKISQSYQYALSNHLNSEFSHYHTHHACSLHSRSHAPFQLKSHNGAPKKIVVSDNRKYSSYYIVEYIWPGQPYNLDLIARLVFVLRRSEEGQNLEDVCRGRPRAFRINLIRERNQ